MGGPEGLPVAAENDEKPVGKHGVTVLLPLALLDANQFALAVDVADFESDGFGDAQAGTVAGHQGGAVFQTGDVVEEQQHLFVAEDDGELQRAFGARKILVGPGHFECVEVNEFQRRNAAVHRFRRQLPLVEQIKQVLMDGFGVEFFRP